MSEAGTAVRVKERGIVRKIDRALLAELDALVAEGPVCVRDPQVRGFHIRAWKPGLASYGVQLDRTRRRKLGRVGEVLLTDAREQAERLIHDAKYGPPPVAATGEPHTLRTFLDDVYAPIARESLSRGDDWLERIRKAFADLLDVRLTDLRAADVKAWAVRRRRPGAKGKRRSIATIRRDLGALSGALTHAVEEGLLEVHPLAKLKLGSAFKVDRVGVVRYLSDEEETRLRDALTARDDRRREKRAAANEWRRARGYELLPALGDPYTDCAHPFVLTLLLTGARFGEITGLTWRDVDLDDGWITLRGTGTKSKQTRQVPVSAELARVLKAWVPGGPPDDQQSYVFPGLDGNRLVDLKTSWKLIAKAAKFDDHFRIHDLRHTFASRLVQKGKSLQVVAKLLGHASLRMTERYAHLNDQQLREAVEVVGRPQA